MVDSPAEAPPIDVPTAIVRARAAHHVLATSLRAQSTRLRALPDSAAEKAAQVLVDALITQALALMSNALNSLSNVTDVITAALRGRETRGNGREKNDPPPQ